jgi:DNA-binding NarL/FixJ family response regulator
VSADVVTRRRIGIVEDDALLMSFYVAVVQATVDLELVFAAATLGEARAAAGRVVPDLCIVDLGLPDGSGIDFVRELKARTDVKVLVSTVLGDRATVMSALKAGADGYILKSMSEGEILTHVRQVLAGFTPISPQVATYLIELLKPHSEPVEHAAAQTLTPREAELLSIFARGLTYDEAAAALGVSVNTIRNFVKKIYAKLNVHTRTEALFEAQSLGLIDLRPDKSG